MRILVVDDDPIAGAITGAVLEDGGYEVALAESGAEALALLAGDDAVAVVISDMNMPGMTGLELFQRIRGEGRSVPFLLLSGDDPQRLGPTVASLDGCLMKDESLTEQLIGRVEAVLARRAPSARSGSDRQ